MTSLHPASTAAWSFGKMPPMPRTLPMIVISPVMARSLRTGTPFSAETIRVTMVIPADGPSFGTPIIVAGTATSWFSCQSVGKSSDLAHARMNWAAAATLSFITRCMEPRLTILPVPFNAWTSKLRMHPGRRQ